MTPQTAPALKPDGDPVTPVIIKSGSDDSLPQVVPGPNLVAISSSSVHFAETVPGPTWVSSQSTTTGRITNLNITDGSITTNVPVNPSSDDLASVSVKFGPTQLIAMESGVPQDNVLLLIMSPEIPFRVPEPEVSEHGDWKDSTTFFPHTIKSVTLMVGDQQKFSYEFQTNDVTLQIMFN